MTGIRRCGKSVMLKLIQQGAYKSGINPKQFISINFEDMNYSHLQTAQALHDEISAKASEIGGKVYLFFDEIQEVKKIGKSVSTLFAYRWIVTFTLQAQTQIYLVNLQRI